MGITRIQEIVINVFQDNKKNLPKDMISQIMTPRDHLLLEVKKKHLKAF